MQRRDLLTFLITFPKKNGNLYLVSKLCIMSAIFSESVLIELLLEFMNCSGFFIFFFIFQTFFMFHLHSLKEPPTKKNAINFTSEVEATISSQESQSPPIQRQLEQWTASQAVEINITEPFQPADFNFPKNHCGKQNCAFQSKWFLEFPWLHYNEQSNSVLCFICMQQNAKSNL